MHLPGRGSSLGQIPLGDGILSSSSSAIVACTPTSTGLLPPLRIPNAGDGVRASPGEGDGGLSSPRPTAPRQDGPLQRFLLCSMNSRMSARGKVAWHWPQVRRSCSGDEGGSRRDKRPTAEPTGSCPFRLSSSSSSDGTTAADTGSAAAGRRQTFLEKRHRFMDSFMSLIHETIQIISNKKALSKTETCKL